MFGVTRQAYYKKNWRREELMMIHEIVLQLVAKVRLNQPRVGTPKLYLMIKDDLIKHNIKMGRDQLHSVLVEHGLIIRNKRKGPKTTNSYHRFRRYPNIIKGMVIDQPEKVWVSDITYILLGKGFCYLSLITDAYSHKVVGYWLDRSLSAQGTIKALKMAIEEREIVDKELIHHSDRGIQYCCDEYVSILNTNDIKISMTENGDPYENPVAERINGILKVELGLDRHFRRFEQAKNHLDKAIWVYNNERLHSSCDYLTPTSAHEKEGLLKKRWKNYYKPKALQPNDRFLEA